ncbi:sunset domain-containing protein [Aminobacter carboxidus]|uniref:sunset domain-containing protein n=1 Tax=Aminobacter carboxidus TaxID=376165 RepID=UPI001FE75B26|nr:hypothetical protein [Aminobacter carboxidus]
MRRSRHQISVPFTLALLGSAGVGYFIDEISIPSFATAPTRLSRNCDINGNVSIDTGERIFHVPGQEYYDETIIRPEFGERWFCSESEARSAGWRKSKS